MSDKNNYKFKKVEKVTGESRIETLFTKGKSFLAYPLRVVYLETECSIPSSISVLIKIFLKDSYQGFSFSKKKFDIFPLEFLNCF